METNEFEYLKKYTDEELQGEINSIRNKIEENSNRRFQRYPELIQIKCVLVQREMEFRVN